MSFPIGTSRPAAPHNVLHPTDLSARSGAVAAGDAVLFNGRPTVAISVTICNPGTHPESPVKPHLSVVRVVTPHGVQFIGTRFAETLETWSDREVIDPIVIWNKTEGLVAA
jgi:hypothetical protein